MSDPRWVTRPVPGQLADQWRSRGLWDDTPMGVKIDAALRAHAEQTVRIHSQERPWAGTFGDLRAQALALAGGLSARGVREGDAVAFQLPNWVEAAAAFYASTFLGAVVVPIVHFYGPKEVGYILRRTEVTAFVTAAGFGRRDYLDDLESVCANAPSLKVVGVVGAYVRRLPAGAVTFEELTGGPALAEPAAPDPDAPVLVAYTSGTTADPKGVIHSHNTLGAEARQLGAMGANGGLPSLTGTPVGHFMGMIGALLIPVLRGDSVDLIDVWDPARVLATMLEYGLTAGSGATYFLTSLLDHPDLTDEHLRYLRFAGLGGAAVPVAVTEKAKAAGVSVVRMYGSTEHPSITGSRHEHDERLRLRTDGVALDGVELKLLDDEGQPVAVGQPGEIWSRGPDCCIGYTDTALTRATFDADGWYRTEDIGVLDADGALTITDRKKDIIIRGGENISAAEVEELLLKTMPEVLEAAVVAVPDTRLGEKPCALLRLAPGSAVRDVDDIRELLLAAGLGRQKLPEFVEVVEDFPRTSTGKIIKAQIRRQIAPRYTA
ncbi:Acyl-CoA synthetase (AMP-forming)/AMP-acid ligase II [Parafrankia irregularis]|uniref:Acyl-CoA synthetase (AMP-forming)/AMP-acid ligase II n=1 Tax=Parafrankia irregularis TaxID=795642 RepID=A0A0S4QW73_9ACTN|nr:MULTISPECIES: AMP-binding protein [Parafrankia]MBE3201598.1 AMP-binding protein [Parafrankia sp. CH37]CUU59326.1 Acyl-CoA synthetase (AMP-forming)/AMP-acid ligase II [Parafrankia irregularis]